jgi:hypothetical protein
LHKLAKVLSDRSQLQTLRLSCGRELNPVPPLKICHHPHLLRFKKRLFVLLPIVSLTN